MMLKQGTFINKKFNKFILGNIWGFLAYSINMMTDSLISGNQLGEIALQAVSIVYPLFSVVYLFAYLIPLGASVLFGKAIGEFNQEEANRTAGTCLTASTLIGVFVAAALWIVKEPFLTYFECTGQLYSEASAYYNWVLLFGVFQCCQSALFYLSITDGETVLVSVSNIADIAANIFLSVVLSRMYGIAGLGMATCIGIALRLFFYLGHFLKKSNSIKPRFCLDFKIAGKAVVLSFSDYMYYLFLALVDIVLNKIIIANCGIEYIPAYSVVNLVFGICELAEALSSAGMGFITCFLGERNNHDMNNIFRKLTRATLVMAAGITVFFFFGAPLMPVIYGLETPISVKAAVFAARVMAFTALRFVACYLLGAVSSSVEKPLQSSFVAFLNCVFSPLLLSLLCGNLWGFTGIVIGMCLSTYFALGIYSLVMILLKGKKGFPIYVEDFGEEGFSYDIRVTPEAVTQMRDAISGELAAHGYEIKNIDLLMEEFFTRVMEKNPNKTVLAECTLLFGADRVRIIIRDDGTLFNFVDENNRIESLNAHVLNSLLEQTKEKNYVLTTSFNRNGFVFEK